MKLYEIPLCLFYHPANIRYATGVPLMDVFTATTFSRHCLVPADGSPVLFEFEGAEHGARGRVDDVRPYADWQRDGVRAHETARRWAAGIRSHMAELGLAGEPLAVDRLDAPGFLALLDEGVTIADASPATIEARMVKTVDEVAIVKINGGIGDAMLSEFESAIRPGVREHELLAVLAESLLRYEGETAFTRLLASGTNTNPWLHEARDKIVMPGDLVAVDTDAHGYEGYVIDVSRTFLCGEDATLGQREAYRAAHEAVVGMESTLRPGMSFEELCFAAPRLPEKYHQQRYPFQAHLAGLEDEGGPVVPYPEDVEAGKTKLADSKLLPGMVLCLECYAGEVGAPYGVKLEDQVLITEDGWELLSTYPFERKLL